MPRLRSLAALLCSVTLAGAGETAWVPVPLAGLGAFRDPPANWRIAGGLGGDPAQEPELVPLPGAGLLVSAPRADDRRRENLFTRSEHGDVELELEFLIPPRSNSGVYLQGRYEIQIFDSAGVPRLRSADCGAIYQRWDPAKGAGREGFEGHPPRVNAARPAGIWQRLQIVFAAPRFDAAGVKVRPARFVSVRLNGVLVHKNVDVHGPTRSAAFPDERPFGPLMIQGDHGPVALRDLRWRGLFAPAPSP